MDQLIRDMIALGESDSLEYKVSFGKGVAEAVCAFANHKGGTVLVGVDNSGRIVGVKCGSETVQNWVNQIKLNTEPSIIPDVELASVDAKQVVIIGVREFPVKPVSCRNRYFKRVANSNHRLNLTEITNLHLQSLQLSWDSYVDTNAVLSDLDQSKVQEFLQRVNKGGRFLVNSAWQGVLEKLGFFE
jgi:ATP-dependent DNA helicase RecG